jgi:uncharacterized integral membrane protein
MEEQVELPPKGRRVPAFKITVLLFLLTVLATFAVKNLHEVEVGYFDYTFTLHTFKTPLFFIICATFTAGFFVAWLVGTFVQLRLKNQLRKKDRLLRKQEEEIQNLKSAASSAMMTERNG